ncbi:hypothetical protein F9C07_2279590 [Aspergillus flavus]|uniref:Uncharacterized protein n=3 Tax=Aspergillus subgen. Circumdati TaxID=2720871 RepID=A0A7U2MR96_ASPFN|nr:unnamed protein product [Aspergillus oryzae RIB40]XP_041140651.1 uncharacterized protein G4B84_000893 [Aspergillus flavus NRRL3357]OOO12536.1 hypothetical protein OAory_01002850 [Aspergillus oryzae]QRD88353.1 hypothetical protein F9C07_2279590 [Aspergillus flavus]KAF7628796.1 hypothetical protein AFLA_004142 [Aspergillus flavus NRRL3357]QMW25648.1 hypothetical protein G4B84_000893 [Aspergillus flavus NRRL3357]BAE56250.1 unnamed protein product [Aspergillus oryzae RIB40]
MKPATDRPFEASRYAWRTDTDGLTASDPAAEARFENAKESYKKALQAFESADKKARNRYHKHEEDDAFGEWAMQYDPVWCSLKAEAQSQCAALCDAGWAAFGQAYLEKSEQGMSKVTQDARYAGFEPEIF